MENTAKRGKKTLCMPSYHHVFHIFPEESLASSSVMQFSMQNCPRSCCKDVEGIKRAYLGSACIKGTALTASGTESQHELSAIFSPQASTT